MAALAGGAPVRAVWANQLGGTTFAVGGDRFVKWQPAGTPVDLAGEAARLRWLEPFVPVPVVLEVGGDAAGTWLVTRALPGTTAVDDRWKADPGPAIDAIGEGLRRFHDRVPVAGCPFDWSVARRVDDARRLRATTGSTSLARVPDRYAGVDLETAYRIATDPLPVDRAVVCHGDACAPNTLVGDDGRFVAHVDLGRSGVADRWADLAVASWSLGWNFGAGWERRFFAAYGVEPDADRIDRYRLLWEL